MRREGTRVVVRGGGDLGSGVVWRLFRSGFRVAVLELAAPRTLRRRVSFAEAAADGSAEVEGVPARRMSAEEARAALDGPEGARVVPVVVDPDGATLAALAPHVLVDARMLKGARDMRVGMAPLTVGLGPGLTAGADVDRVVETQRGPTLGRVIEKGAAVADTGVPAAVAGVAADRVLRAPAAGALTGKATIGALVERGETVAEVAGVPVVAGVGGLLRGLVRDGTRVAAGDKVGDVDPRGKEVRADRVSDKALSVAGGVLESILAFPWEAA